MVMPATTNDLTCYLLWAHVNASYTTVWRLLDPAERERARGYRHAPSRARFVLGRGLARIAVAQVCEAAPDSVRFRATCRHCGGPHGRLEADTSSGRVWVSVSHSGARVGVALTHDFSCGLDIEQVALRGAQPPANALSEVERADLASLPESEQVSAFIRIWTRKEAVLKATGDGLVISPADLTVSAPWQPARLVSWAGRPSPHIAVHLRDLDVGQGYCASLATLGTPVRVVEREADICLLAEMAAPW
jgi:4'-phosphopantetheinyl transferase